jgi:hypothetical protein
MNDVGDKYIATVNAELRAVRDLDAGTPLYFDLPYFLLGGKMSDGNPKPWDHLRHPVSPIGPGKWRTCAGESIAVEAPRGGSTGVRLKFSEFHDSTFFTPGELREIGEFLIALADQGGALR